MITDVTRDTITSSRGWLILFSLDQDKIAHPPSRQSAVVDFGDEVSSGDVWVFWVGFTCLLARHGPQLQLRIRIREYQLHTHTLPPKLLGPKRNLHDSSDSPDVRIKPPVRIEVQSETTTQVLITSPFLERSLASSPKAIFTFSIKLYNTLHFQFAQTPSNSQCMSSYAANMRASAAVKSLENCPSWTSLDLGDPIDWPYPWSKIKTSHRRKQNRTAKIDLPFGIFFVIFSGPRLTPFCFPD